MSMDTLMSISGHVEAAPRILITWTTTLPGCTVLAFAPGIVLNGAFA
jgi:hypothetical protein